MPIVTSKMKLLVLPVLIHTISGTVTIGYNFLCRQLLQVNTANDAKIKLAAIGYFLAASGLSGYLNRRLILDAKTSENILMIPYWRALTNTLTWLGSIPILAGVAIVLNGAVNYPNFYNFCVSILIGWLIATTYSTLIYLDEVSRHPVCTTDGTVKKLLRLNTTLFILAIIVPVIAATSVLVLIRPENVSTGIGSVFNGFLFLLYIFGAYGAVYVGKKTRKIRGVLRAGGALPAVVHSPAGL